MTTAFASSRQKSKSALVQKKRSSTQSSGQQIDRFNTSSLNSPERVALDSLIQHLSGQANLDQQKNSSVVDSIIQSLQGSQLTREQAIQDTQGLIGKAARTLAEGQLAKISGQAEAGGASSSALAALLGNDARARTAESVGTAQIQAIVDYVNSGTGALTGAATALNQFNATPDKSTQALLDALGIAKGSQQLGQNISNTTNQSSTQELITQLQVGNKSGNQSSSGGGGLFSLN